MHLRDRTLLLHVEPEDRVENEVVAVGVRGGLVPRSHGRDLASRAPPDLRAAPPLRHQASQLPHGSFQPVARSELRA